MSLYKFDLFFFLIKYLRKGVPDIYIPSCCFLAGGYQLQFQYQAGSGPLGVSVDTAYRLADNNWHSVSVERNRLVLDK